MRPNNLYTILISYSFIFIGLGIVLEAMLLNKESLELLRIPIRYFYWVFNFITFSHLLLLIFYKLEKDEQKRSRLMFFSVVNHFIVSLIAIGLYAFLWLRGSKEEALISVVFYLITFVFFISVVTVQAKK
ncbi:MAG: hypothetical protein R2753_01190 [Chitinophagales bacterium]